MILDSLEQLADQDVDLTDDVYERFFESCTAASALMRHTDQHMRGRMLGQALELLLTKDVSEYLEWEIDNHQSAYAVEADMYKLFFLAIRDAVRQRLGSNWQASHSDEWDARITALIADIADTQSR